ncbi:MAG: sigma-70 family RNA polymerase sigma factor [Candidatus Tectomicrobia bacterium]|nr:sigma-70 family RNA polymerase sigma factor [Candidatus Tectomicrobia bacterium]
MWQVDPLPQLLARCARGDQAAFSRLYQSSAPKLFALAIRILRREDWAEEALQEGFLNIWRYASEYRSDKGTAMTWMASIVRHQALDLLRRTRRETSTSEEPARELQSDPGPGLLEQLLQTSEARALRSCLEQLEAQQRQSIMLAYFHGYTHQELAHQMNAPLGTVKTWIRRGLERLRRCLEQ